MKNFIGIDPSLSQTAVVVINESGKLIISQTINTKLTGPARLRFIREEVFEYLCKSLESNGDDLIAIEHYAMGAKFGREAAGELGGVLRVMMFENDYKYIEIPPLRLKQFATGKATAEKDHVLMEVYKRWGVECKTNDEADAFILAQMARAVKLKELGRDDEVNLTGFQAEVIGKILNPESKNNGKSKKKSGKEAA